MMRPLREGLVVGQEGGVSWIRCAKCAHTFCREDDDWREACKVAITDPTTGGPHREIMVGKLSYEERYCPACGALLEVSFVET